jgi:hypothetical protein
MIPLGQGDSEIVLFPGFSAGGLVGDWLQAYSEACLAAIELSRSESSLEVASGRTGAGLGFADQNALVSPRTMPRRTRMMFLPNVICGYPSLSAMFASAFGDEGGRAPLVAL